MTGKKPTHSELDALEKCEVQGKEVAPGHHKREEPFDSPGLTASAFKG